MSHWFPEQVPVTAQSGIAMVVALILLLVITLMGLGIAYVATVQSDMVAAVVNKPLSIDAAESCFDNAVEWLGTSSGKGWVNGEGLPLDLAAKGGPLAGKTMQTDTIPLGQGDSRSAAFVERANRAFYTSCIVEKISSSTNGNTGNEIGTSNGYGASSFVYVISITAQGEYNVPLVNGVVDTVSWNSGSSRSVVEAVVQYTP
jgi:Tfp pilus assembly protein PilX